MHNKTNGKRDFMNLFRKIEQGLIALAMRPLSGLERKERNKRFEERLKRFEEKQNRLNSADN
jgi:hypothetical protein